MRGLWTLIPAVLLATHASAQDQRTGSLVPGGGSSMVEETGRLHGSERTQTRNAEAARRAADEAHGTMRLYASCVVASAVGRDRDELLAFLTTRPDAADANRRATKIESDNCFTGVGADSILIRFTPGLLRGMIFRQLYFDLSRQPSRVSFSYQQLAAVWSPDGSPNFVATQRFADCVVAADPAAADRLLKARIGTPDQDAAVGAVAGRMRGCLQQGLTLQMSRIVLEGVLAEALFRRATAPPTALPAGQR